MGKLKPDQTLFKDQSVFEPAYTPDDFLFRDSQIKELTNCIKPALKGSRPLNAFIYGRPATGKTTAAKIIFSRLDEESGSKNIMTVHINCHIYNSQYRMLAQIHKKLFGYLPPETGIPMTVLYDKIFSRLEKEKKVLIIALDDMNFYDIKLANSILYDMVRAYEIFPKAKTALWCISVKNEMHRLDDKVRSSFVSNTIEFHPYKKEEIKDILKARSVSGLYANVISDHLLNKIAGNAPDLRHAIEILKKSAMLAENELSDKITESHVDSSIKTMQTPASSSLFDDEKILIEIIKKKERESGELYEEYKKITGSSYPTFYRMVQKLRGKKIINVQKISKEKGKGRTSKISIRSI